MSYVALYRKFRPGVFAEVAGQDHVVRALKNQLTGSRIGHAYLFTGTRGTGKTSVAKIFAKAVNCLHPVGGEPCNECENCKSINAGNFVDVVEVDAASNNGVDDIRRIIEEVRYTPVKGAYKVFIIDEAHMITGPAFNAFLKTLEEPPAYAIFILATTEPHKLPVTILSRVQRYDFRRISTDQIAANLGEIARREGVQAQEKALRYIARMGDGSMRDSVSLLDKCIAFHMGESLTYENVLDTLGAVDTEVFSRLFRSIYASDVNTALDILDNAIDQGRDLSQFAADFIWYVRNVLMVGASDSPDLEMLGISAENMALIRQDAASARADVLMRYIRILSETIDRMRFSSSKQILLEVAVIKLAKPQMEEDLQSLADRIRQLEAGISVQKTVMYPPAGFGPAGEAHWQEEPARQTVPTPQAVPQEMPAFPQDIPVPADYDMPGGDEYYADYAALMDEEDYPANPGPRMKNPDAFAGLFDDGPIDAGPKGAAYTPAPKEPSGLNRTPKDQPMQPSQEPVPSQARTEPPGRIWQSVLAACDNRRIRTTLNKCSARTGAEDILEIYAPSEFLLKQLKDEQVIAYLSQLATNGAGRQMHVHVRLGRAEEDQQADDSRFPEELLNNINFNIGTEEY